MSNKGRIILSVVCVALSITLLAICTVLAEEKIISSVNAIIFIVASGVLVCISLGYAAKTDYETGVYQCRKCGHIFKPSFKAYLFGMHTLTTRHLKCPDCDKKSWCKRYDNRNKHIAN